MAETNTQPLGYDEALTEATGVQSIAKQLTEMTGDEKGEPSGKTLEMVSQFLDALKVEDPGMADFQIELANQWKQIETSVSPEGLSKLLEASRSIPQQEGGGDFLQNLIKNVSDRDLIIEQLGTMFKGDQGLSEVLSSKPDLKDLWYGHLYLSLKMATIVAASKD